MGRIPDGSFKNWQDTEVVHATDYKQEREMLRVAINDNDTRILNVEGQNLVSRVESLEENSDPALRTDFNAHKDSTSNPHSTTASQVGAYSTAQSDSTFVKKVDTGAFFGKGASSYNAGFMIFPVNQWIAELDSGLFQISGSENIIFKKGGIYLVNFESTRSDLPSNQRWAIGISINDNPATLLQSEIIAGQYGWNQSSGPNLSKIQLCLNHVVRVNANDYINFNNSSDDGPRGYTLKFSVIRIGD